MRHGEIYCGPGYETPVVKVDATPRKRKATVRKTPAK